VVGSGANLPESTTTLHKRGPVGAVDSFLRDQIGARGLSHARKVERVAVVAVSPDLVEFGVVAT